MLGLSPFLQDMSTKVKLIVGIISFIVGASAFVVGGKALLAVPQKLDQHAAEAHQEYKTLERMLCIQVADHRKMDWNLCYVNPAEVVPSESK